MSEKSSSRQSQRQDRLAAALRENLKRRKTHDRALARPQEPNPPASHDPSEGNLNPAD